MHLDPVIGILLLASFALLFASAALHKWRDPQRFAQVFAAYGLLPHAVSLRFYWLIPLLETALALGLLPPTTRVYVCSAAVLLLLSYAGAMALNLGRGRREIACGCGGPDEQRPIAAWMVWRNVLLAALLASALWPPNQRVLLPTDWLTIGFGIAAAVLVYLCTDRLGQVLRQARAMRGTR